MAWTGACGGGAACWEQPDAATGSVNARNGMSLRFMSRLPSSDGVVRYLPVVTAPGPTDTLDSPSATAALRSFGMPSKLALSPPSRPASGSLLPRVPRCPCRGWTRWQLAGQGQSAARLAARDVVRMVLRSCRITAPWSLMAPAMVEAARENNELRLPRIPDRPPPRGGEPSCGLDRSSPRYYGNLWGS